MKFKIFLKKLSWPGFCLVMMLQRSPIVKYLAEVEFSLMPRTQHLWSILAGAVTVGAYNTVTAASGIIEIAPGSSSTTVSVGEQLRVVLWVGGKKANSPHKPELWEYTGTLPGGVTVEINLNAGTFSFTGIPTEAGQFPVSVTAWEKKNKNEGSNDTFDLTIIVEGSGISFTQQPANQNINWGGTLHLSATVDTTEGTTFQWQRILSGQAEYSQLEGATDSSLVLDQLTTSDEGMYRLVATNQGTSYFSNAAMISVTASNFQSWLESVFPDPFAATTGMDQDPDLDMLNNLVEFTFGLDPNQPQSQPLLQISLENINGVDYTVYSYPPISAMSDAFINPEGKLSLSDTSWSSLTDGVDGVIIASSTEAYTVKIPLSGSKFEHLRISAQ